MNKFSEYYPLAQCTAWKVGGTARFCLKPQSVIALQGALREVPLSAQLRFLGLGSNSLVSDQGFDGYLILTRGLNKLSKVKDSNIIDAQAGVSCATLARFAARQGLGGLEFLAGIPGTVGGALAMNAGANGSETWDFVRSIETIARSGEVFKRSPEAFSVSYRKATGKAHEAFLSASFQCKPVVKKDALALIKSHLDRRQATQPINQASCGCVFRNPKNQHAGELIEQAGLKNLRIGGAVVSEKHANFIINEGSATASEIFALIQQVSDSVFDKFGVRLIPEVKIIGEIELDKDA